MHKSQPPGAPSHSPSSPGHSVLPRRQPAHRLFSCSASCLRAGRLTGKGAVPKTRQAGGHPRRVDTVPLGVIVTTLVAHSLRVRVVLLAHMLGASLTSQTGERCTLGGAPLGHQGCGPSLTPDTAPPRGLREHRRGTLCPAAGKAWGPSACGFFGLLGDSGPQPQGKPHATLLARTVSLWRAARPPGPLAAATSVASREKVNVGTHTGHVVFSGTQCGCHWRSEAPYSEGRGPLTSAGPGWETCSPARHTSSLLNVLAPPPGPRGSRVFRICGNNRTMPWPRSGRSHVLSCHAAHK